jgi:formylglycine-generating enzyme required for sulfatase activity
MKISVIVSLLFCFAGLFAQPKLPTNPPGTVKIKDNLFIDTDEISNNDYHEYVNWLRKIFGKGSEEYKNALPDTSVCPDYYYKNPEAGNYPVIGINYNQAVAYCKWRTDRVFERDLVLKKIIIFEPDQDRNNYFSIENIKNGSYKIEKIKELNKTQVTEFRLPSKEEWEFAAAGGLDPNLYPYGISDTSHIKFKLSLERSSNDGIIKTSSYKRCFPNGYKICNIIGNVAEMTLEKGIAKGGSWKHPLDDCKIQNNISYDRPTNWLGLRCVCGYKGF